MSRAGRECARASLVPQGPAVYGRSAKDPICPGSLERPTYAQARPSRGISHAQQLPCLIQGRRSKQLYFTLPRDVCRDLQHIHSAPRQQGSRKKLRRGSNCDLRALQDHSILASGFVSLSPESPTAYSAPTSVARNVRAGALANQMQGPATRLPAQSSSADRSASRRGAIDPCATDRASRSGA